MILDCLPEDARGRGGFPLSCFSLSRCHGCHSRQQSPRSAVFSGDGQGDKGDDLTRIVGIVLIRMPAAPHGVSRAIRGTKGHLKSLLSGSSEPFHRISNGLEVSEGLYRRRNQGRNQGVCAGRRLAEPLAARATRRVSRASIRPRPAATRPAAVSGPPATNPSQSQPTPRTN